MVSPGEDKNAWVIVLVHSHELPATVAGQAPGMGSTRPDVCEQGPGCLAGMSVVYARWEVSEPWAFPSLSIHLPRALSHSSWAGNPRVVGPVIPGPCQATEQNCLMIWPAGDEEEDYRTMWPQVLYMHLRATQPRAQLQPPRCADSLFIVSRSSPVSVNSHSGPAIWLSLPSR